MPSESVKLRMVETRSSKPRYAHNSEDLLDDIVHKRENKKKKDLLVLLDFDICARFMQLGINSRISQRGGLPCLVKAIENGRF